ncbi:MAG: hypothetical protein OSA98_11295 [Rubripirellula sp.]|nr:hypothetical protein [Rubripirellula sp.]
MQRLVGWNMNEDHGSVSSTVNIPDHAAPVGSSLDEAGNGSNLAMASF